MASTILSVLKLTKSLSAPIRDLFGSSSSSPCQLEADLEKLGSMLHEIQAVVNDAEEKEEASVKLWLIELKRLAYDAEDVLAEFEFELLRYNIELNNQTSTHKRKRQVSGTPQSIPLHDISFQHNIMGRIAKIRERFEEIEQQRKALHLKKEDGIRRSTSTVRLPTGAMIDESHVYGREADMDKVVNMLVSDDHSQENVTALSIVGLGGLGKTTLSQMVYKDERVQKHFQVRSWVSVSEDFNVVRLARAIIGSITKERSELHELNPLQDILKQKLTGKKFLLVLDDVWNENQSHWESLKVALLVGAKGSRILITTRSRRVSDIVGTEIYQLNPLSNGDCWSLFSQYAFGWKRPDDYPGLVSIGIAIINKCGGLPLTAKILGSLLSCETDEFVWNRILRSDMWNAQQGKRDILPVLRLSYQYLPSNLKQCFAFCGIFRGLKFQKDQLVRMWIAQGFIHPEERKRHEDIAYEYFNELLQRSLFQLSEKDWNELDDVEIFMMHDLISDLAQSISPEDCSVIEEGNLHNISRNSRHSSVICESFQMLEPSELTRSEALRTFLLVKNSNDHLNVEVLDGLFSRLKYLRVLDLSFVDIAELPDSVGNLKQLRYIGLSGTNIERLPESVSSLYNLQTLDLQHCELVELPKGIKNLINLRHLVLHNYDYATTSLSMMPQGIGKLTSLETLPIFVLSEKIRSASIGELKDLNNLRGELFITGLHNAINGRNDAEEANLKSKEYLEMLLFEWGISDDFESVSACVQDEKVLENLKPHTNLKELGMYFNYRGFRFPCWIGDPSFSNLKTVILSGCVNCRYLPPLGQLPSLEFLSVSEMISVQSVGREFFGNGMVKGFPSLLALHFRDIPRWNEWWGGAEEGGEFPRLRYLQIQDCPKLKSLSLQNLTSLDELSIQNCEELISIDCLNRWSLEGKQNNHFDSIKRLEFLRCPKLGFRPDEQLPSTLEHLYVHRCPLLEEWYRKHADKLLDIADIEVTGAELSLHDVFLESRAREEKLEENESLQKLKLGWYLGGVDYEDKPDEVLKNLRPHTNLKELIIEGYRGSRVPSWVGEASFSKLVKLTLSNFTECEFLPPLGQLPSLKELQISKMQQVECVGNEFYGGGRFISLEKLEFIDMPEWEEWQGVEEGAFPNLNNLIICNCPKLRRLEACLFILSSQFKLRLQFFDDEFIFRQINHLPGCTTFSISHFPNLREFPLHLLPHNLKELEIEDCKRLATLPGLPSSVSGLVLAGCNEMILTVPSSSFASLSFLWICRFPNLVSLPLRNLSTLRELCIFSCPELVSLNFSGATSPPSLHNLLSLKLLSIKDCPKLEFFQEEQLPCNIQYINITDCPLLVTWFQRDWSKFAGIQKVWIDGVMVFTNDYQYPDGALIANVDEAISHIRSKANTN